MELSHRRLGWTGSLFLLLLSCCYCGVQAECPKAIFAFGASMSDTGNSPAAFPYNSRHTSLPYGQTFGRPANRWSNGRVVVDFFAQALGIPLLSPGLQSVAADFRQGVNFAFAGVMTQNNTHLTNVTTPPSSSFYYWVQTRQFRFFKENTLAAWNKNNLPGTSEHSTALATKPEYFTTGLYFMTFGTNDFVVPVLLLQQKPEEVDVASIANAMVKNTEELYFQGGRTFMVYNTPPLGCYPSFLGAFSLGGSKLDLDPFDCIESLNTAISTTNALIRTGLQDLRLKHPDATFVYADLYSVLQTLFRNGPAHDT